MKDLIERQKAIDAIMKAAQEIENDIHLSLTMAQGARSMVVEIERLPSAQPDLDEWCTDCKEYDAEKHHCPGYNRVIREALKDAKQRKTGKWIHGRDGWECSGCRCLVEEENKPPYNFCPQCGTYVRGDET